MRIEKWKQWFQVRNDDGNVVAQYLSHNEALIAIGGGGNFRNGCTTMHLGNEPVHQRKGTVIRRINKYP